MQIKYDLTISIIGIIAFFVFCACFLFNIGFMSQIIGSKFLEEFDDKKKLIEDVKKNLFDYKKDILKKIIFLFPYFISVVLCYTVSPFLIEVSKKSFPNFLPREYQMGILIWILLLQIFYIGEAFWGINEKHIVRNGSRIYYKRPLYFILFIIALYIGALSLDSVISMEEKQYIMTFLNIENIENFQLIFMFTIVTFINNIFVAKLISRFVALLDQEIYINFLKEKNNYYSFYGMASMMLSMVMIIISVILAVKYSIFKYINLFTIVWALLLALPLSILAGQRVCFVEITKRYCIYRKKVHYQDVYGKKRIVGDWN